MATYAPEYSQENMSALMNQYNQLMQPQYDKSARNVKASMFGQGLGTGSPYQAGLGEVNAQRLQNTGQVGMNLLQTGLGQQAQERLIAEQRAYEDPWRQKSYGLQEAGLTGMLNGQQTLSGQQFAEQKRQNALNQALQEAGLTGMYGGQQTLANQQWNQQFGLNKALQEAGMTGMYGGQQTMQAQQNALQRALAEAGLTGMYTAPGQQQGTQTMQGRQFEFELGQQQALDNMARNAGFQYGLPEMTLWTNSPDKYGQIADRSRSGGTSAQQEITNLQNQLQAMRQRAMMPGMSGIPGMGYIGY